MQCEKTTKAFGAIYEDGLSLNVDKSVKTEETPKSIMELCNERFQNQELEVGMVIRTRYNIKVMITEIIEPLDYLAYGKAIAKGVVCEYSKCNRCAPFTIKPTLHAVAVFENEIEQILAKRRASEELLKCGTHVKVKTAEGANYEGVVTQIDFSDKQYRYLVDIGGAQVWCAEKESECNIDQTHCNSCWIDGVL